MLFLMYKNHLSSTVHKLPIAPFANDTKLFRTINSTPDASLLRTGRPHELRTCSVSNQTSKQDVRIHYKINTWHKDCSSSNPYLSRLSAVPTVLWLSSLGSPVSQFDQAYRMTVKISNQINLASFFLVQVYLQPET